MKLPLPEDKMDLLLVKVCATLVITGLLSWIAMGISIPMRYEKIFKAANVLMWPSTWAFCVIALPAPFVSQRNKKTKSNELYITLLVIGAIVFCVTAFISFRYEDLGIQDSLEDKADKVDSLIGKLTRSLIGKLTKRDQAKPSETQLNQAKAN